MDNFSYLPVQFYLGGQFVHYGESVHYIGGDEAMSYIEREKVSISEIVKHLKQHMNISAKDSVFLHWLFPGKELNNGLRPLSDEKSCTYMVKCIADGAIADVYVEVLHESSEEEEESNYEDELEEDISEDEDQVLPDVAKKGKGVPENKAMHADMEWYWQLAGIPCCHAISALFTMSKDPEDYIADCYTVETYNNIYQHCMLPMEGMSSWPISDHPRPHPPGYVKMPGRPRKERRIDPSEAKKKGTKLSRVGTKIRCRLCRSDQHNARKCPQNPEKGKKNVMRKRMEAALASPPAEGSKSKGTKRRKRASTKWVPTSEDQLIGSTIFQTGSQSHDEPAH